jgi:secreted trypsin-like serine protease
LTLLAGIPSSATSFSEDAEAPATLPGETSAELDPNYTSPVEPSIEESPPIKPSPAEVKPLVIGGQPISIAAAPWQVALLDVSRRDGKWPANQYLAQFCGGSIIASQWILTAAHCVTSEDGVIMDRSNLRILSGTNTLSQTTLDLSKLQTVSEIIIHPSYNADSYSYDVALIKLSKPLTFASGKVQRVAVAEEKPSQSSLLTVSGWGAIKDYGDEETYDYTAVLQRGSQRVESDSDCEAAFGWWVYLPVSSLCVGDGMNNSTAAACFGDSGGPVIQPGSTPRLVGVVSYGARFCAKGDPWVAANVPDFLDWIESHVIRISVSGPIYAAAGYQDTVARINLSTLRGTSVRFKVCELGCYSEVDDPLDVANLGEVESASASPVSDFKTPEVSTSFSTHFSQSQVPGLYELRAFNTSTGDLIASTNFIISDGATQSFRLKTDAKQYFPYRDGYRDSIVVTASALGLFGEPVPMLNGRAGLKLSSTASTSKSCTLSTPALTSVSCRLNLDTGKYSRTARVSLTFNDFAGEPFNTSMETVAVAISKTEVSSISVSRNNSTVFPSKDGYKDSTKITIRVNPSFGANKALKLKKGSKVTIKRGSKVIKSWTISSSGAKSFTWNGKDGSKIVPGTYKVTVQANGPEGSKTKSTNISVSAKKLVSVKKTKQYKAGSLLKYQISADRTACTISSGELRVYTLWYSAVCFGDVPLPTDAKHEYGAISATATFTIKNEWFGCSRYTYVQLVSTTDPGLLVCSDGKYTVKGKVSKDTRSITPAVWVSTYEKFKISSVTVTFNYKTLK